MPVVLKRQDFQLCSHQEKAHRRILHSGGRASNGRWAIQASTHGSIAKITRSRITPFSRNDSSDSDNRKRRNVSNDLDSGENNSVVDISDDDNIIGLDFPISYGTADASNSGRDLDEDRHAIYNI
ncbi:hypothetical protein DPMN_179782 [Dreissena polymorpha]|uniref:Uncharacterized protein n=1 Tax=Dreissena polymorpha TaxID=45954 RepID=A0A9D4IMN1_DREPO|nr:hypothetical protein DPMN_179782 [Dreissena polymorpha]